MRDSRTAALEREVAAVHREHASALLRYAETLAPDAAQDAMQEAFLRYFLVRSRGRVIDDPGAWLRRVVRNRLTDAARSAAARGEVAVATVPEIRATTGNPETACGNSEFLFRARAALAPRELQCMYLRIEGLRYRQIGQLLDIRTGTVGALLARAYKKIREMHRTGGGTHAARPSSHN